MGQPDLETGVAHTVLRSADAPLANALISALASRSIWATAGSCGLHHRDNLDLSTNELAGGLVGVTGLEPQTPCSQRGSIGSVGASITEIAPCQTAFFDQLDAAWRTPRATE